MTLAVVDASALVAFYVADDPRRAGVTARLALRETLVAPAHLDAEVVSALRGLSRRSPVVEAAVPTALDHLARLPIQRLPLAPLLRRTWGLRRNLTAYDAAYVALAESLDAPLITCDARLARSSGAECAFDIID